MPGVVSVFPNSKRILHTTHSWDFVGLPEDNNMNIFGHSTMNQANVIIGIIDTGEQFYQLWKDYLLLLWNKLSSAFIHHSSMQACYFGPHLFPCFIYCFDSRNRVSFLLSFSHQPLKCNVFFYKKKETHKTCCVSFPF